MRSVHHVGIVATALAVAYVGLTYAELGPLSPPAGPVAETGPSLADLADRLEDIQTGGAEAALTQGPWQVFIYPQSGNSPADGLQGVEIESGRVLVHAITVHRGHLVVFNGVGTLNPNGNPASGTQLGRIESSLTSQGSNGLAEIGTRHQVLNVEATDGLFAAWALDAPDAHLAIYYKELD